MAGSLPSGYDGRTIPVHELPSGYEYRVTRYADVILRDSFPDQWKDLVNVLDGFQIDVVSDIHQAGGNRSTVAIRFDGALQNRGWGKQNMDISTSINEQLIAKVRSHEIDMFKLGPGHRFPGIAVEMEWNNKDPFFDRDLSNYYTLHRAGALAVGIIVTRGPRLQRRLQEIDRQRYGASTTHWGKLMPRVDIGGGGECPLFLVGIELERASGL